MEKRGSKDFTPLKPGVSTQTAKYYTLIELAEREREKKAKPGSPHPLRALAKKSPFDTADVESSTISDGSSVGLLLTHLPPLDGPGEMGDGDDEETVKHRLAPHTISLPFPPSRKTSKQQRQRKSKKTHLFESSAIPAKALYQAANAASSPKKPPALWTGTLTSPAASRCR